MGAHESSEPTGVPPRPALTRRLTRHGLAVAIAAAGFVVVAGVAFVAITVILRSLAPSSPASNQAIGCANGICDSPAASLGAPALPVSGSLPRSHHPGPSPGRAATAPSPVPVPPGAPTPTAADVTFSYSAHQDQGGFAAQLTIVNQGDSAISNWQISLGLPGDHVHAVSNADWQTHGSFLILQPSGQNPSVPPGGQLTIYFTGQGHAINPASCTFNGSTCIWAPI